MSVARIAFKKLIAYLLGFMAGFAIGLLMGGFAEGFLPPPAGLAPYGFIWGIVGLLCDAVDSEDD
jgi:hypothetical protein